MKITLKKHHGFDLVFEADNVKVTEDIESREYQTDENGKTLLYGIKRDIKTEVIEQFVNFLDDMIYYREAEFDSTNLIERLFEKLPQDKAHLLSAKLKRDYEIE